MRTRYATFLYQIYHLDRGFNSYTIMMPPFLLRIYHSFVAQLSDLYPHFCIEFTTAFRPAAVVRPPL